MALAIGEVITDTWVFEQIFDAKYKRLHGEIPTTQSIIAALKKLQEKYFFYMWNEEINEARFVTSWDTTEEDIDDMIRTLDVVFG